jgi:hypothetical protein
MSKARLSLCCLLACGLLLQAEAGLLLGKNKRLRMQQAYLADKARGFDGGLPGGSDYDDGAMFTHPVAALMGKGPKAAFYAPAADFAPGVCSGKFNDAEDWEAEGSGARCARQVIQATCKQLIVQLPESIPPPSTPSPPPQPRLLLLPSRLPLLRRRHHPPGVCPRLRDLPARLLA